MSERPLARAERFLGAIVARDPASFDADMAVRRLLKLTRRLVASVPASDANAQTVVAEARIAPDRALRNLGGEPSRREGDRVVRTFERTAEPGLEHIIAATFVVLDLYLDNPRIFSAVSERAQSMYNVSLAYVTGIGQVGDAFLSELASTAARLAAENDGVARQFASALEALLAARGELATLVEQYPNLLPARSLGNAATEPWLDLLTATILLLWGLLAQFIINCKICHHRPYEQIVDNPQYDFITLPLPYV